MTRNSIRTLCLMEDTIKTNLIDCRGDIPQCAYFMGITPRELDSVIKSSPTLQAVVLGINQVVVNPDYVKFSSEQFRTEYENLASGYKLDGLNVIHELAMEPHGESAAMAEVRLKAAIQLRGLDAANSIDSSSGVLHQLNELYHQTAPRLQSMRATLTLEFGGDKEVTEDTPSLRPALLHVTDASCRKPPKTSS